ncbi:DUF6188 family protein [Rhodococcus sp. 15-2388-1-1a]|uniref:DUF6188 family protein n=1 Tax=Rhodococcus sp. 15-2388-1-1a TaxID=2023142 RepID=UPI0034E96B15
MEPRRSLLRLTVRSGNDCRPIPEGWTRVELPLVRHTIVSMECGFSLTLRTDRDCEIRIESNFRVTEPGTVVFRGLPHTLLSEDSTVQRLIGRLVAYACASDDGGLLMEFADRASLVVPFDPDFEAWTVAAPEGFKAVSVAGGGLTVWD